MKNPNSETSSTELYYSKYSFYTDVQILEILRNHKDYQEAAINAVVKIALERKLINSEQDLIDPQYQNSNISGFSWFPKITDTYQHKRLLDSIFRVIYILALLPIIFGFMKFAEGNTILAISGFVCGILWFVLGLLLQVTKKTILILPLFIILFAAILFAGFRTINQEQYRFLDFIIFIVGTAVPSYLLIYVNNLLNNSPR